MQNTWLDSGLSQVAIAVINGYQTYISPRKGFACSHRILFGGESCSDYIKRMFIEQDLSGSIQAARQRFGACKEANQILKSQAVTNSENEENPDKNQPRKLKVKDTSKRELNSGNGRQNIDCCCYEILECNDCVFPECGDCIPELNCSPDCGSCGG